MWPVYRDFHFHQKNWARYLNTMFVPRGENMNKPIFKSSKFRGGMLKLQTDEIINAQERRLCTEILIYFKSSTFKFFPAMTSSSHQVQTS